MRVINCVVLLFGLLWIIPAAAVTQDKTEAVKNESKALPKEIKEAREKLAGWVNKLKNNTNEQIVKQIGKPSEKATWEFGGKKELLLRYKSTSPDSILELYFHGDRVVTASLQLLSD